MSDAADIPTITVDGTTAGAGFDIGGIVSAAEIDLARGGDRIPASCPAGHRFPANASLARGPFFGSVPITELADSEAAFRLVIEPRTIRVQCVDCGALAEVRAGSYSIRFGI